MRERLQITQHNVKYFELFSSSSYSSSLIMHRTSEASTDNIMHGLVLWHNKNVLKNRATKRTLHAIERLMT